MFGTLSIRRKTLVVFGALALAFTAAAPASASESYVIAPGDSLYSIAKRHGINVDALVQLNGIENPHLIYAGQPLLLAASTSAQPADATPNASPVTDAYTVQPGDSLWSIASRFGITVAQLVEANRDHVPDQNLIFPGQQLVIPGGAGGAGAGADTPTPQADPAPASGSGDIGSLLNQTAVAYGLDPALVQAIAWQESGWQQGVVSSSGALGVMQVMPATGGWISSELVGRQLDIQGSTSDNILAGVVYLEWLIRYTGSEDQAIASYYQGPNAVSSFGWYGETYTYVDSVKSIRSYIHAYGTPPR
jgi:N-acetylmuramoyl-L-alanine amidase